MTANTNDERCGVCGAKKQTFQTDAGSISVRKSRQCERKEPEKPEEEPGAQLICPEWANVEHMIRDAVLNRHQRYHEGPVRA